MRRFRFHSKSFVDCQRKDICDDLRLPTLSETVGQLGDRCVKRLEIRADLSATKLTDNRKHEKIKSINLSICQLNETKSAPVSYTHLDVYKRQV